MNRKPHAPDNWEHKNPQPQKATEHGDIPLRPEREPKEKFPLPDIEPPPAGPGKTSLR